MPNGNPDFDTKATEQWFAQIAGVLMSFAQRHNLLVEGGGLASFGVSCNAGDIAAIFSSWQVDDYDRFTRFIHWRKPREVTQEDKTLLEELERELSGILAVPLGKWNQVAEGYSNVWGRYTKDEFAKMTPEYPDPI